MESLSSSEREMKISGAIRACKLSSKQKHKWCDRIVEPLVLMLDDDDDDETIEAALFALLSLASGSERNKIQIAKSRVLQVLLNLIRAQNKILFELSITSLLILSSCSANKLEIAASGAIPLLVHILTANANDISQQAILDIISTLHNLSTSHQIIPSIVLSNITTTLILLIYESDKSSELVEKATGLLERIVSFSEIALKEAASLNGAIQALVEAVEEGSSLCKEYAVGILLLVCRNCPNRNRGRILSEGVMPGLLQLSVDGTYRAKEKARTLLLLLRDCTTRKKQWRNVILEKAMEKIDADERVGVALGLVEETIAKLST